jgi:hypothetical protein
MPTPMQSAMRSITRNFTHAHMHPSHIFASTSNLVPTAPTKSKSFLCLFSALKIAVSSSRKARQFLICTHNEPLIVVAMWSATKIVRPSRSAVETQPQLQPALVRLSAMISQYLTRRLLPRFRNRSRRSPVINVENWDCKRTCKIVHICRFAQLRH